MAAVNEQAGGAIHWAPKVDVIWNITRLCPWDCTVCCVDAHEVTSTRRTIRLRSKGLDLTVERVKGQGVSRMALAELQRRRLELDFGGKCRVIDHLQGFDARLDISGGDPLYVPETMETMAYACERIGRDRITLTTTGPGLHRHHVHEVAQYIGELNFTYDAPHGRADVTRPEGYAKANLRRAAEYSRHGVKTRAECPLSSFNVEPNVLRQIYGDLHEAGIDKLLVMRLFPVGRGIDFVGAIPTRSQYRTAIHALRELENAFGSPKLRLQCALRHFDDPGASTANPCDLVHESFGLMPDGTLLASAWAYDSRGDPLGDEWVLGNLAASPMSEILASARVLRFRGRLDENFGHCKIFAWRSSRRADPFERLFDATDPLLAEP